MSTDIKARATVLPLHKNCLT